MFVHALIFYTCVCSARWIRLEGQVIWKMAARVLVSTSTGSSRLQGRDLRYGRESCCYGRRRRRSSCFRRSLHISEMRGYEREVHPRDDLHFFVLVAASLISGRSCNQISLVCKSRAAYISPLPDDAASSFFVCTSYMCLSAFEWKSYESHRKSSRWWESVRAHCSWCVWILRFEMQSGSILENRVYFLHPSQDLLIYYA